MTQEFNDRIRYLRKLQRKGILGNRYPELVAMEKAKKADKQDRWLRNKASRTENI